MKKLDTKGFGIVEILLLIVLAGLIGGVGYYAYNSQKKTNTTLDNASKSQAEPQKATKKTTTESAKTTDPYAGWQTVTTADKVVTIKIPASWTSKICPGNDKYVYVAPNQQDIATCSSGNGGRVSVGYGDIASSTTLSQETSKSSCDKEFSVTQPTVNGVQGYRVIRTNGPIGDSACQGLEGTKYVTYFLNKDSKSYTLNYMQLPTANDELANFDLIVKSAAF